MNILNSVMGSKGCVSVLSILAMLASTAMWSQNTATAADQVPKASVKAKKPPAIKARKSTEDTPPNVNVTELDATLGRSNLVNLSVPIGRVSVGNPVVADVILLNPKQLYVIGKTLGSTNIILWNKQGQTVAMIEVNVSRELGALNSEIQKIVPGGSVKVRSMGENIVLEGHAPDARTEAKISNLAEAFVGQKVVNMIMVDGVQQVMLEVKVAEINRTLLEKLGIRFSLDHPATTGGVSWALISKFLSNPLTQNVTTTTVSGGTTTSVTLPTQYAVGPGLISAGKAGATTKAFDIDAQKSDGLVKILAEPNIVAISGQEGSFLAGGEILIPVQQGQGTVTLESKQFGVGLRFTPTVLEGGRINMRVVPEVTELVGFTTVATSALGSSVLVPQLSTRRVSTTVELKEGQSFAIGGLLQDNVKENIERFPMLGEIPILGALFRSSEFQKSKTELMIVVTPRLVKPLAPDYKLPTDGFKEPTRSEFFMGGKLEGEPEESEETAKPQPAPAQQSSNDGHQLK